MKAAMLCHSLVVVDDKQNIDVQFAKGSPAGQVQKRASQEQWQHVAADLKMSDNELSWLIICTDSCHSCPFEYIGFWDPATDSKLGELDNNKLPQAWKRGWQTNSPWACCQDCLMSMSSVCRVRFEQVYELRSAVEPRLWTSSSLNAHQPFDRHVQRTNQSESWNVYVYVYTLYDFIWFISTWHHRVETIRGWAYQKLPFHSGKFPR